MQKPEVLEYFVVVFQVMSIGVCLYTSLTSHWIVGKLECNTACGLEDALVNNGFIPNQTLIDQLASESSHLFDNIFLLNQFREEALGENETRGWECGLRATILDEIAQLFKQSDSSNDTLVDSAENSVFLIGHETQIGVYRFCIDEYFSDGSPEAGCGRTYPEFVSPKAKEEIDLVATIIIPSVIVSMLFLIAYLAYQTVKLLEKMQKQQRYIWMATLLLAVIQSVSFLMTAIFSDQSLDVVADEINSALGSSAKCLELEKDFARYMVWVMFGFNCLPLVLSYGFLARLLATNTLKNKIHPHN